MMFLCCSTVSTNINSMAAVTIEDLLKARLQHTNKKKIILISRALCRFIPTKADFFLSCDIKMMISNILEELL